MADYVRQLPDHGSRDINQRPTTVARLDRNSHLDHLPPLHLADRDDAIGVGGLGDEGLQRAQVDLDNLPDTGDSPSEPAGDRESEPAGDEENATFGP